MTDCVFSGSPFVYHTSFILTTLPLSPVFRVRPNYVFIDYIIIKKLSVPHSFSFSRTVKVPFSSFDGFASM